jgi:hypothetical protein
LEPCRSSPVVCPPQPHSDEIHGQEDNRQGQRRQEARREASGEAGQEACCEATGEEDDDLRPR